VALPPVPRRPNESVDAWRNRIAALEARYDYSKAALDRGDFGSAASGFDAILREEPGFLDAPVLLVQARAGLRAAALDVLAAGNRLDAAGDWFGALQQYERAREVDGGTPGIEQAVKRVREKLRVAGQDALDRGREHERVGRPAAALQEYDKALQWLPNDDPNREVARARAEQLRNSPRD
jgi:tetratricopeptide (TPR) repeat protein